MQTTFEQMIAEIAKTAMMFDLRMEFRREPNKIILLRMRATTMSQSIKGLATIFDYKSYIFYKTHISREGLLRILNLLEKSESIPFPIPDVCKEIFCPWNPSEIQMEYVRLSRGQWYGNQRRDYPAMFYQSYFREEKMDNIPLNVKRLPLFPSISDAESFYLYDKVLETSNPNRPVLQIIVDDIRAWINSIVVTNSGLKVSIVGELGPSCELKLLAKRPGLVQVLPLSDRSVQEVPLKSLPSDLNLFLTLDEEILDQRFISEQASLYAPTQDVSYEVDEKVSIEGILRLRGESLHHDYKETFTPNIFKTICAFANTEGGSILIGVDDDGNVVGVKDPDAIRLKIENFLEDNTIGMTDRKYDFHPLLDSQNQEVVVIQVRVAETDISRKPVALLLNKKEIYYVRRDGSNRVMKREDFASLINRAIEIQLPTRNQHAVRT